MKTALTILEKTRNTILETIENITPEQLITQPTGFNNTILWNVTHLLVTQQILCYKLSNLPMKLSDDWVNKYRKGSFATHPEDVQELAFIKTKFIDLVFEMQTDYASGLFKEFTPYETSMGVVLDTIETAIQYNNMHEGIHLGSILALKKLV